MDGKSSFNWFETEISSVGTPSLPSPDHRTCGVLRIGVRPTRSYLIGHTALATETVR